MLIDNFEQHFERCVVNAQNLFKSARNHINSLSSSKNVLMKFFRDSGFSNRLHGKKRKPGNAGISQKAS